MYDASKLQDGVMDECGVALPLAPLYHRRANFGGVAFNIPL
jgi:hypothetical protein